MEHRSASGMEQLLSAQIRELEERIVHLRTMKKDPGEPPPGHDGTAAPGSF